MLVKICGQRKPQSGCGLSKRRCAIKSYDELKPKMVAIHRQIVDAKKRKRADALKDVKRLYKEFGFTTGILEGSLAEVGKK